MTSITLQEMAQLSALYNQSHRKYHNINHIHQCMAELENYSHPDMTSNKRAWVEAAIWYHDAIYNPYSTLNEWHSMNLCALNWSDPVPTMVIYTRRHLEHINFETQGLEPNWILPIKVMLDIDLSGFGKDRFVFAMNGMNIRHEYYQTKLKDFLHGRRNFYRKLEERPTLYYTDHFQRLYHDKAVENMNWEIALLDESLGRDRPDIWCEGMEDATSGYDHW